MITINGSLVKHFVFPGGEVNIRLPKGLKVPLNIVARIQSSDDVMALILTYDALRRHYGKDVKTNLTIPYYPYARQDRVCSIGEALSKEVFFKLITSQCQTNFTSYDVHSDTDKVINVSLGDIFENTKELKVPKGTILVAPDLGASKKVKDLAERYNLRFIQGEKLRDPDTGKLSGFGLTEDTIKGYDFKNYNLLIVDDICDGGGTFIGLADVIRKELNPKSLSLYVTHGIFSRGFDALENYFDMIYTTDTLHKEWLDRPKLKIFNIVGD